MLTEGGAVSPKKRKSETFKLMRQNGRVEFELAGLAKLKPGPEAGAKAPGVGVKQEVLFTISKLDVFCWFFFCNFLVLTYIFRALECVLVLMR